MAKSSGRNNLLCCLAFLSIDILLFFYCMLRGAVEHVWFCVLCVKNAWVCVCVCVCVCGGVCVELYEVVLIEVML